jgi:hypothetical protein
MKMISACIVLSFGLTLMSCGAKEDQPSAPASVANACHPTAMKPKLYKVTGGTPEDPTPRTQLMAGFFNQNCEEKRVYLSACSEQGAKAMLGLWASEAREISNEEWIEFTAKESGGYFQQPHLSCTSGTKITPQWDEGHKPEVHIVSGKGGQSSLDVASRSESGRISRLHYVALHSCLGLRRQLGAEAYADPSDPDVLKPLQLAADDEALYLTCAKERAPQESREGWSLVRTLNAGGLIYLARYRATLNSPSQDLVILKADGRVIYEMEESEQKAVETAILRRLGLDATAPVILDNWDTSRDQILYDLCTTGDCTQFSPQHQRLVDEDFADFDEKERNLVLQLLPDGRSLHTMQPSPRDASRLTAFAQCPKESDLATYFGLLHPEEPKDWWTRVNAAAQNYRSFEYEEFPCLVRPSVCRITIGDEDLSAKASNLYNGISSIMRRPINGACASASELELLVTGRPKVTGQPFKIGNLQESVQRPFTTIRLIGGAQGLFTLDRQCTNCQAASAPAVVITGPGRFILENLAFRSLDDPTQAPSIALQVQGTTAGRPFISVKGLRVQGGNASGDQPFATGLSVLESDIFLWSSTIESYYQGLDAQNSRVSLFGVTGTDKKPMGSSHFKVVGPTTASDFPGTDLKPLHSLRALRLNDSLLFLYGTVLDAPFGLDMSGTKSQSIAEARGFYNHFMNSGNSLGTRSSALYLKGYAKVNLTWSQLQDLGGLIEFDAQNFTQSTEGNFNGIHIGSELKRNRKIILNAERGTSNYGADCVSWDDINKVCAL